MKKPLAVRIVEALGWTWRKWGLSPNEEGIVLL